MKLTELYDWFTDLAQRFGDKAPSVDKIQNVLQAAENHFQTAIVKYIGSGDNGIVFTTADGDILKFTIDRSEALLWSRLKNQSIAGIVSLKDVVQIGDSHVYAIKAEYAPNPISRQQIELINQALSAARKQTASDITKYRIAGNQVQYQKRRTLNFVRAFQHVARIDPAFRHVPDMLMNIADKYGAFLYDLRPDNFKLNASDEITLVDPSVPDLRGEFAAPRELAFEELLHMALTCRRLII